MGGLYHSPTKKKGHKKMNEYLYEICVEHDEPQIEEMMIIRGNELLRHNRKKNYRKELQNNERINHNFYC